jgi:hypothetical protein
MFQVPIDGVARQVLVRVGHDVPGVLLDLDGMASPTIPRAHYDMDVETVVVEGIGVCLRTETVAFGAAYHERAKRFGYVPTRHFESQARLRHGFQGSGPGVTAFPPRLDDARLKEGVTIDTLLAVFRYRRLLGNERSAKDRDAGEYEELFL